MRSWIIPNPLRALATLCALGLPVYSAIAATYHVAKHGSNSNSGKQEAPFLTIQHAANLAQPGDTITVHEGVYREYVNPPRGGESDDNRIVYQAAPGENVVIKGSEIIKSWEKVQGGVWKATLPNSFLGDFNPYSETIGGEWYRTPEDGYDRHTGAVYLNGQWLTEAPNLDPVLQSVGDEPFWFGRVDEQNTTIWAQFQGANPNKELVEINERQSIFYPDKPGRDYITVRGFTMSQAATPWSGAMSEQIGLIGAHWSKAWIIENNIISHSMNTGITLGRYGLGTFGVAMPPATAPGFVKSCELALAHGWSKQSIGSHIVRNNHISHCEKNGIHGSLGGIFSTIEGNTIHDIGTRGWLSGPDVAGLKLLGSHDTLIRRNHIHRCGAVGGIWLDWMAQGTRVTGNLLHDNSKDLFMEVDHGPFLIDNNLFLSGQVIGDWSQGAAYVHNLFTGTVSSKQQERETPYFEPHTVEGMKLSDIKHKDARYYNNLFVDECRPPTGDTATNLQSVGNAYLEGHGVELEEKADGLWLRLHQDAAGAAGKRPVVTTELLGKANIPDAPFEQPDGTPYRIDTDYFGEKRSVDNPAPGPFRSRGEKQIRLKVWPKKGPENARQNEALRSDA